MVTGEKASGWAGSAEDEESPEEPDGLETELSPAGGKVQQQEGRQSQGDEFLHGIALPFCCSGRGPGEELAIANGNLTA